MFGFKFTISENFEVLTRSLSLMYTHIKENVYSLTAANASPLTHEPEEPQTSALTVELSM